LIEENINLSNKKKFTRKTNQFMTFKVIKYNFNQQLKFIQTEYEKLGRSSYFNSNGFKL